MCNCSENESKASTAKAPVTLAGPTLRPDVPLSRSVRFADEGAESLPFLPHTLPQGAAPIPPLIPCKLDFREGCYQINFQPTGSLTTFEGTLRVDRSAPDGGADHLIASGDLYTHRPVIGPVVPVHPVPPITDADEGGEPTSSAPAAP